MPATKLKAIIFDIGRVLVRIDVGRAMQGLASGGSLSPSELWTAIEKDPRWPIGKKVACLPATGISI